MPFFFVSKQKLNLNTDQKMYLLPNESELLMFSLDLDRTMEMFRAFLRLFIDRINVMLCRTTRLGYDLVSFKMIVKIFLNFILLNLFGS